MRSTDGAHRSTTRLQEISEARCLELLGLHTVGRVAWNASDGPQILPVTYAVYDNRIVLRTSPYGALSQLMRRCAVAFEVDQLDSESNTGWSVVVRGIADGVSEPRELVELWTMDGLVPWAAGLRNVFISITPRTISGRTARTAGSA